MTGEVGDRGHNAGDNRRHKRVDVNVPAVIYNDELKISVVIENISVGGARLKYDPMISIFIRGSGWFLMSDDFGVSSFSIRWRTSNACGVAFSRKLDNAKIPWR